MRSPQLDVAGKRISSPVFIAQHHKDDQVPDHQFYFFIGDGMKADDFKNELFSFGEKMKRQVQIAPFHWKGFGTLRYDTNEMLFESEEIVLDSLQALTAEKVLRKDVQHNVLVGDQEMTSQQITDALNRAEYKKPWHIIAGWTLLILSLIAILIYLYMKNFQITSTGLGTW